MSTQTCAYVARKDDPESWHGTDSSDFWLDLDLEKGGLGITEWRCPHPPLEHDNAKEQYCVFHTDTAELPDGVNERDALLKELDKAGDRPWDDRPEHRGQFVGATFGAINLIGETIAATDNYDIRFDHAQFSTYDDDLDFFGTTFETRGQYPISFYRVEFTVNGSGNIRFPSAIFQANGTGDVLFPNATFRAKGDGDVRFPNTMFLASEDGDVNFQGTIFRSNGTGDLNFRGAMFQASGESEVRFPHARFIADEDGDVSFQGATFLANGNGCVRFWNAAFRANGDGNMRFRGATFQANGDGEVGLSWASFITDGGGDLVFRRAKFRANDDGDVSFLDTKFWAKGDGNVVFQDARFVTDIDGRVGFTNASFLVDGNGDLDFWGVSLLFDGNVVFARARFRANGDGNVVMTDINLSEISIRAVNLIRASLRGANLTGANLQDATLSDISVDGATTCEHLYTRPDFDPEDWDATARAYHDLKTVFSDHGLVGKARKMHVLERRARSEEMKAANNWSNWTYLLSQLSWIFTGYGVRVRNLSIWMVALFLVSTAVYVAVGVEDTLMENVSYSVLAYTVAPPEVPSGIGTQIVMMVETFFGTLSIVLLGYILGNRERF